MKKYMAALLFALLSTSVAYAKDTEKVELNAFGFPDKSFIKMIEGRPVISDISVREKPDCADKNFAKAVRENAKPYIEKEASTIVNKRRNVLITKNIDNFSDLSIEDALNMDNNILKARMVELKINNRIDDSNIKLCQSDNPVLKNKLFVLMYDDNSNVKVELLNLNTEEIPAFYFYDK